MTSHPASATISVYRATAGRAIRTRAAGRRPASTLAVPTILQAKRTRETRGAHIRSMLSLTQSWRTGSSGGERSVSAPPVSDPAVVVVVTHVAHDVRVAARAPDATGTDRPRRELEPRHRPSHEARDLVLRRL